MATLGCDWMREMAEGSDSAGSEMEEGGGRYEGEWSIVRNKKRKKNGNRSEESDFEERAAVTEERREEFKVIASLAQEGASFRDWNPMRLTKSINKEIGEVRSAKILRNGLLLIICRDGGQQRRALRMYKIDGKEVQCKLARSRKLVRGAVTGIPIRVSNDDVKENISNAKVSEVKRLKASRNGIKSDSLSVLITFDEEKLPEKIFIG